MTPLFDRLLQESGLSPLFARSALQRACARAGVDAQTLSPSGLRTALPEIERTIRTYLHAQTDGTMLRIQALLRER